jgi:hypothetical protein
MQEEKRINDALKHCTEFNASLQQDSPRRTPILLVETKPIQSRSRKCDPFRSKLRTSTKQPSITSRTLSALPAKQAKVLRKRIRKNQLPQRIFYM